MEENKGFIFIDILKTYSILIISTKQVAFLFHQEEGFPKTKQLVVKRHFSLVSS